MFEETSNSIVRMKRVEDRMNRRGCLSRKTQSQGRGSFWVSNAGIILWSSARSCDRDPIDNGRSGPIREPMLGMTRICPNLIQRRAYLHSTCVRTSPSGIAGIAVTDSVHDVNPRCLTLSEPSSVILGVSWKVREQGCDSHYIHAKRNLPQVRAVLLRRG